jgi:hypothetical protein
MTLFEILNDTGIGLCVRLVATTQLPSLHKAQCHQMTQNPCYKLAAVVKDKAHLKTKTLFN